MTSGMYSSNTPEWATPIDFFNKLNEEFHFDLDVAADDTNHKCDRYYTKETDGLANFDNWTGMVWCNPPYGREIGKWVKACSEYRGGSNALTGTNRHKMVPRLYIWKIRNQKSDSLRVDLNLGTAKIVLRSQAWS